MSPKKKLISMCTLTLILALMDGALTYLNTPDLKLEANPLVSVLGLGWWALFITNAILYLLYIAASYFYFIEYRPPKLKVTNFKEYASQLLFNRPDKFIWFFLKFPHNAK